MSEQNGLAMDTSCITPLYDSPVDMRKRSMSEPKNDLKLACGVRFSPSLIFENRFMPRTA